MIGVDALAAVSVFSGDVLFIAFVRD